MDKIKKVIDTTGEYLTELPIIYQVAIGGILLLFAYGLLLALIYQPLL